MGSLPPGVDLCTIPAGSPPDSETVPNLSNPVSLEITSAAVSIVMLALTYVFVAARAFANRSKLSWSDYFTFVALILHSGNVGIIIALGRYNRHQWDIPACWFDATYLKLLYAQVMTFGMTLLFSKAAILLLYLEIFGVKIGFRVAVYIGLTFNALLCLTFFPMASYYNAPHAGKSWESLFNGNGEESLMPWGIVIGAGSVLVDIYILILPLHTIADLHLARSKRLQLMAVFGTALMGVTASIVALVYRVKLLRGRNDSTWNQASVAIANVAEDSIALIVGSAPAFSKFLRQHVVESRTWKSITSAIRPIYGNRKGSQSRIEHISARSFRTFGSPHRTPGQDTLELTDSALIVSKSAAQYDANRAQGDARAYKGHNHIMRTLSVSQEARKITESTDQLV